jgi:hypothetical protein
MPTKARSRISFLVLLIFFVWFFSAIAETCYCQETSSALEIKHVNISVSLTDLDLPMREVNFTQFATFGFNFNASANITALVRAFDGYIGDMQLRNVTSGGNWSNFQINTDHSSFVGYFKGGPETYPFDEYEFNVTLDFLLPDVSITENTTVNANWASTWPLRVQFEGPSNCFVSTTQTPSGPRVSMQCTLNRPQWRGYATLLPVYLMFALMGFITLLKTDSSGMTYRLSVCLAVLTSAMAYSFSIQSTLPPGRYYLSIPEALIYTVIGSLTIFIVFTIISHRMVSGALEQMLMDMTAAIFSTALLAFFFLTFYTNSVVNIFPYTYVGILRTEWTIIPFLFAGILILLLWKLCKVSELPTSYIDRLSKWFYIVGYSLSAYWVAVVLYINWSLSGSAVSFNLIPTLEAILFFAILSLVVEIPLRRWVHRHKIGKQLSNYFSYMVSSLVFSIMIGNLVLLLTPNIGQLYVSILQAILFLSLAATLVCFKKESSSS